MNILKWVIGIVVLGTVAFGVGFASYYVSDLKLLEESVIASPLAEVINHIISPLPQEISAPKPLRSLTGQGSTLTAEGIIVQTNIQRSNEGKKPLTSSTGLTKAAQAKLDDLFARQYFEHESPDGKGPDDLATAAGYDFLKVGENLALGNFPGDDGVVTAWMNSPGHRANIVASGYTQIGVATRQGTFEGQKVWIAVQEFGTPQSVCSEPSATQKKQIDQLQAQLTAMRQNLDAQKKELAAAQAQWQELYDQEKYEEANPLHEKIIAMQTSYNAEVDTYNELNGQLGTLAKQYNSAVEKYNACAGQYK